VNRGLRYSWLFFRALWELARYETIVALRGFSSIRRRLKRQHPAKQTPSPEIQQAICDAVLLATCFYWKPVLCLQRSACAVRLLRKYGIAAKLVIGYRPAPFLSHAWVEVDGRVVNSSAAYQSRMRVLCTV